ncbi:sigma-70 family RNA polymerase sigma factor [Candidatus Enterococcus leclercqii]|uniref:sigma-70 family RNA polymerase sigma factor n=1 Tax=Candidatus Enterococcus leclercqii TaxID=1857218 RepID=UPI001379E93F|nr:sigma-70 family RNA polymerase sigma factor [Enterococcus sp. CU9D]KAF1293948.1 hypothetical protein BAU14_11930 [Enterococcus sp. CU9D]
MKDREIRWVKKAKNGNRRALNKLMKYHYKSIYLLAYSYVKNESDALDVVQDASLKAVGRLVQLQQEEYFSTWLNRIVINEAKYLLVRRRREQDRVVADENMMENIAGMTTVSKTDPELLKTIHQLEDRYEEVLMLFYFNDLSIKEIACLLEINENTVKTRLVRGRAQLKLQLTISGYER